jgi:two-component system, NtrC family, C4-dicarboxylate transport sensor histidine kinase DctB
MRFKVRYSGQVRRNQISLAGRGLVSLGALILVIALFAYSFGIAARRTEIAALRADAQRRALMERSALLAEIDKFRVLPFVLIELPDMTAALSQRSTEATGRLNTTLAALAGQTGASVLYAVDSSGVARAASNANGTDSFVGHNFRFRPYFVGAMQSGASEYFAQGTITGRPGMFLTRRVGRAENPAGVIVVKIEFDRIERLWRSAQRSAMVIDRDGVVVIASDPALRLHTIMPLPQARRAQLIATRQFGDASLSAANIQIDTDGVATSSSGKQFAAIRQQLPVLGWQHIHFEPLDPAIAAANARIRLATLIFALVATTLCAAAIWVATRRRRMAASRSKLEHEVSLRTAELTGAYDKLRGEVQKRELADSRYRAAREELAQANRLGAIGTITTSVAHELNQPVATIRTAADNAIKLLARNSLDRVETNLGLIISLTSRIGTITSELLSYARRGRQERSTTTLDDILDGALMLIGDSFVRAKVTLDVERAQGLPSVYASRIRIEQVLVNLLQNALDEVSGCKDGRGRVRLAARATSSDILIVVEDNGPGVAEHLSETIFQPFFTGKSNGTGIGLGISREIVSEHGGTLTVGRSSLGGASFTICLPQKRQEM